MQLSFFAMIWMRTVDYTYVHQIIWPLINNQYFMVSPSASTHLYIPWALATLLMVWSLVSLGRHQQCHCEGMNLCKAKTAVFVCKIFLQDQSKIIRRECDQLHTCYTQILGSLTSLLLVKNSSHQSQPSDCYQPTDGCPSSLFELVVIC